MFAFTYIFSLFIQFTCYLHYFLTTFSSKIDQSASFYSISSIICERSFLTTFYTALQFHKFTFYYRFTFFLSKRVHIGLQDICNNIQHSTCMYISSFFHKYYSLLNNLTSLIKFSCSIQHLHTAFQKNVYIRPRFPSSITLKENILLKA